MAYEIQLRRDTAANWTSANPTLASGEAGYETDTGKLKIGDGTTAWTSLAYFGGSGGVTSLDSITGAVTLVAGSNVTITDNSPSAGDITIAASGGGSSPLTTKGDIYGYDTADARIPVGTDGQVLTADSTQALGVKWAAGGGGGGAVTQIFYSTLSSAAANFDITSISGSYNELILYLYLRSDYSGGNFDVALLTFNGDTGNNYTFGGPYGGTSSGSLHTASTSAIQLQVSCDGSAASQFAAVRASIPQYAATTGYKSMESTGWHFRVGSAYFSSLIGGAWSSTSAITQITVTPQSGSNWDAGSSCSLYGVT